MKLAAIAAVASLLLFAAPRSYADYKWTQPTSAELSMTAEPKAPNAPAIILSYEEIGDAGNAEVLLHLRIKVLTSGGLSAGTIKLPGRALNLADTQVVARTIHSDGSVLPFTGTPHNSLEKDDHGSPVIALSGVEVGSILEVICHFNRVDTLRGFYFPVWLVQREYFMREAHFSLKLPGDFDQNNVRWVAHLPPQVAPKHSNNFVTLDVADIPPTPSEDFSPPLSALVYNVRLFFYNQSNDTYWSSSAAGMDHRWSNFDTPSKTMIAAVNGLIRPTDTTEQKLRKLYDTVMQFENTDFVRIHSHDEDKKNGVRVVHAIDDVFMQKRGSSYSLTMLFIALARAAGFSAYPMQVTSRTIGTFDPDVHDWSQLDSVLAIVPVDGQDIFFDPGTRFCPFAHVAPWHSDVIGISIDGNSVKTRYTRKEPYAASRIDRTVELKLAQDGTVSGTVKLLWTGNAGLSIRQAALLDDKPALEKALLAGTQAQVPPGVQLALLSLDGLTDGDAPLIAKLAVTGSLGTATRTRLLLPQQFFESTSEPLLKSATRTLPIAFPGAYSERDLMTIALPAGYAVESTPPAQALTLHGTDATYKTAVQWTMAKSSDPAQPPTPTMILQRVYVINRIDYKAAEYADLRDYFSRVATNDHEQVVLQSKVAETTTR